jgi:predicted nucleic acid-binding protein
VTLVADSSVVVAALVQRGSEATWAEEVLSSDSIAAPAVLHSEVATVLRRRMLAGEMSDDLATGAYIRLLAQTFDLHDYEPLATRIWELRHTVTIKDAWFVALAESLNAPLATLDLRLTRAPGPRCRFLTPPVP